MKNSPISLISHILSLPGETPVRLYSFQNQEAWDAAEEHGYWTGRDLEGEDECDFASAYEWMRSKMQARMVDHSGDLPMWAWLKRPSATPKSSKEHSHNGLIRLTAMVPRSRILLSDFERWHYVINKWTLCETEEEFDSLEESHPIGTPESDQHMQASWENIFDFTPTTDPELLRWAGRKKYFQVQVCADRFYWDEIVSVRRF